MKCIQCQTDNNLRDRTANFGHCSSCNHKFVFEPTAMTTVKITDPMFKRTLDELSANNTLFFTKKQLTYFLDKRLRKPPIGSIGANILLYIFTGVIFTGFFGFLLSGGKITSIFPFAAANLIFQGVMILIIYPNTISKRVNSKQRRTSARNVKRIGFFILLFGLPISLASSSSSYIIFAIVVLMGMGSIYLGNRQLSMPQISQEFLFETRDIQGWLQQWQVVNGAVFRLLTPPSKKTGTAAVNPDVTAYSFDRLVVCQTAEVAQMLIANNFHFENNCAILSIGGYPEDIFDITMQMLYRNADLKVYLLHDCSPQGMSILHQLKTSDRWFKNSNVSIIDVGLTPNQVMTSKHLFIRTSTNSAQTANRISPSEWTGLSPDEVTWLTEGNYVELESFTPQQLIQVLNHGIAGTQNLLDGNDSYTSIGGSDGYLYTSESFG